MLFAALAQVEAARHLELECRLPKRRRSDLSESPEPAFLSQDLLRLRSLVDNYRVGLHCRRHRSVLHIRKRLLGSGIALAFRTDINRWML